MSLDNDSMTPEVSEARDKIVEGVRSFYRSNPAPDASHPAVLVAFGDYQLNNAVIALSVDDSMSSEEGKRLVAQAIWTLSQREECAVVVLVSEAWAVKREVKDMRSVDVSSFAKGESPETSPDRFEVVSIAMTFRGGARCMVFLPITRSVKEPVVLGTPESIYYSRASKSGYLGGRFFGGRESGSTDPLH